MRVVPPPDFPLAISACTWRSVFLGVFLPRISDSRPHRSRRSSACWRLSPGRRPATGAMGENLVRTDAALVVERGEHAGRVVLDWHGGGAVADRKRLAPRNAADLLRGLSVVRRGSAGFLRIPIGWHAPGSWPHFAFLGADRI